MKIAIPIKGSPDSQDFMASLPLTLHKYVVFYGTPDDCGPLRKLYPEAKFRLTPSFSIAKRRQLILEESGVVLIVDDDISIFDASWDDEEEAVRPGTPFTPETPDLWDRLFVNLHSGLDAGLGMVGVLEKAATSELQHDEYRHGLIGPRRTTGIYAVSASLARTFRIRLDALDVMGELDFNLQLLRSGVSTASITRFCYSQTDDRAEHQCTVERPFDLQEKCAERLAVRHPGLTNLSRQPKVWDSDVDKNYWVRCAWTRAARQGGCLPTPRI